MATFSPTPTYYRITLDDSSPNNYVDVFITPLTSIQYNNSVVLSGTQNNVHVNSGDTVVLNGYQIGPFVADQPLSEIIGAFNAMTPYTNVMASENWTNYLTLQSIDPVQQPITLSDSGDGSLARLGLPGGEFSLYNPVYAGSFGTLYNGNTAVINGVTITFNSGALDRQGAVDTINAKTAATHVHAYAWTGNIQLNHLQGQPILFGTGSPGTSTALGFADNTVYGGGMTPATAILMEQGNMRWRGIQNSIESIVTPHYYGSVVMTGSTTDGYQLPDTVSWTVGIEHVDQVSTVTLDGEPEATGTELVGTAALKRLVARALTQTYTENRKVYNNDISVGSSSGQRLNPVYVKSVTAVATDSSIYNLEQNITVTQISNA